MAKHSEQKYNGIIIFDCVVHCLLCEYEYIMKSLRITDILHGSIYLYYNWIFQSAKSLVELLTCVLKDFL